MGGRWRYKLIVSLSLQSLQYNDTHLYGWTLTLQTYSVLKVYKVYSTQIHKFMSGQWRYKHIAWFKFTKLTIHRYTNLWVAVDVTDL